MKKSKKWGCALLALTAALLLTAGGLTAVIDPFFHYHAPLPGLAYPMTDQRYQNDGIVKHFAYDAIITGTSMSENFLASELDELFGVNAVKVCYSGATFREINENLQRAIEANPDIKMVVRSLDGDMLANKADAMRTDAEYPEYLYDDSVWNDVSYVFNKEVLFRYTAKVLQYTLAGNRTTDFDAYSYWADDLPFGVKTAMLGYSWDGTKAESRPYSQSIRNRVVENIRQNVIAIAEANPEIDFYCFFPPYSVLWWQGASRNGTLERQVDIYITATEELLRCENIHLFSFTGEYDYVVEMNNYVDLEHYNADMNSRMLQDMHTGRNRLTQENYREHWEQVRAFFGGFDYASHFTAYGYPLTEAG